MSAISYAATGSIVEATGKHRPISMTFSYDPYDALAVKVIFHLPEGEVTWTFARDLLFWAYGDPSRWHGHRDVLVKHFLHEGVIWLQFSPPEGTADVITQPGPLADFLRRTHLLMPVGHEVVNVDHWIGAIFANEGAA